MILSHRYMEIFVRNLVMTMFDLDDVLLMFRVSKREGPLTPKQGMGNVLRGCWSDQAHPTFVHVHGLKCGHLAKWKIAKLIPSRRTGVHGTVISEISEPMKEPLQEEEVLSRR